MKITITITFVFDTNFRMLISHITCLHCKDHKGARDNPITVFLSKIKQIIDISINSNVCIIFLITRFHTVQTVSLLTERLTADVFSYT